MTLDALDDFSKPSIYALLDAASVSPTAAHRGPSIAAAFHAALVNRVSGERPARARELGTLVAAARAGNPGIATMEDFQPYDIRDDVAAPWGNELFRVVPGSLERPAAVIRQHERLAAVIDRFLLPELGYGLRDAGEIVLRRLDEVADACAPYWSDAQAPPIEDDPYVSDAEVAAAGSLRSLTDLVAACSHVDRARRAASELVVDVNELLFAPSHPVATFGPVIGVNTSQGVVWIPSGCLIEALAAVGAQLASRAANASIQANEFLSGMTGNHIGRLMQGSSLQITGPIGVGSSEPIHSLVVFHDPLMISTRLQDSLVRQVRLDGAAPAVSLTAGKLRTRNYS